MDRRPTVRRVDASAVAMCFVASGAMMAVCLRPVPRAAEEGAKAVYAGSTWSIVAVDQDTGDVGVAAATCLPKDVTALAALVPGMGAAAVQGDFAADNRNAVLRRLERGESATDIVAAVANPEHDSKYTRRQYGVATLHDGGSATDGFSGPDIALWSGRSDSSAHGVTVQGNYLHGEAVVHNALEAFVAPEDDGVVLADRLLRALEAGSAAGGDRRCNMDGVTQTALSAFISVARADQPPFAARDLGEPTTAHPEYPWLHLSVTEDENGPNPMVELRRRYEVWRAQNLPPCPSCRLLAIEVPPGGGDPPPLQATAIGVWTEPPDRSAEGSERAATPSHEGSSADGAAPVTTTDAAPAPGSSSGTSGSTVAILVTVAGASLAVLAAIVLGRR